MTRLPFDVVWIDGRQVESDDVTGELVIQDEGWDARVTISPAEGGGEAILALPRTTREFRLDMVALTPDRDLVGHLRGRAVFNHVVRNLPFSTYHFRSAGPLTWGA